MRHAALIVALSVTAFLHSCNDDVEDVYVTFTGVVKYLDGGSPVSGVQLRLLIIDQDLPFDRANPGSRIVLTKDTLSFTGGKYLFTLTRRELPENAFYFILVRTDSLIQIDDDMILPCLAIGTTAGTVNSSRIHNDIRVDHATYLQVKFKKTDLLSTDRVQYSWCMFNEETSLENPDITITHKLPFFYFKNVNIQYTIVKESGEHLTNWINDIPLMQSDTTKVLVNY